MWKGLELYNVKHLLQSHAHELPMTHISEIPLHTLHMYCTSYTAYVLQFIYCRCTAPHILQIYCGTEVHLQSNLHI